MPFAWGPFVKAGLRAQTSHQYVYDSLTVSAKHVSEDIPNKIRNFSDGVQAKFGPDVLTCDSLELHSAITEQKGIAHGNVTLTDPDGTLQAQHLEFGWNPAARYANADNLQAKMAGATIRARHAEIRPGIWTFTDFYFTTDRAARPLYSVSGRKLMIYPGRYAKLQKPTLSLLGNHLLTIPSYLISLDKRVTGLRPPNLEYRGGAGFGYNWVSGFLVDHRSTIEFHSDAYPGSLPGNGVQYTRTFISADTSKQLIVPKDEFSQRFDFGYIESVLVSSPDGEVQRLSEPKAAISVDTKFNAGVSGRGDDDELFSVPLGVTYERGGKFGQFEELGQLRLETIARVGDSVQTRGLAASSLEFPTLKLSSNLSAISRVDGAFYFDGQSFGWARASGGFVYRPVKGIQLSAGAYGAVEGGTPEFDIDPLAYHNGIAVRADYALGPRTLSYMMRDDARLGWFDTEYEVTQTMGCLEAYLIYRRYPGDSRYGVTLRLDQITDLLTQRKFTRPSAGK